MLSKLLSAEDVSMGFTVSISQSESSQKRKPTLTPLGSSGLKSRLCLLELRTSLPCESPTLAVGADMCNL